jgi:hypothetical protein
MHMPDGRPAHGAPPAAAGAAEHADRRAADRPAAAAPPAAVRLGWIGSLVTVLVLVVVAVAVDAMTGINAIGASARVLWNGTVFAVMWTARSLQGLVALIARRRVWRLTSFLTSIGFGYTGRVFLSARHSARVRGLRTRARALSQRLRARWLALPFGRKLIVVAVLIAAQLYFVPAVAEYIVLFPVGFLIPPIVYGARKAYSWAGDLVFAKVYWKYCGPAHQAVTRRCARLLPVRLLAGASRRVRLQYLTAWRLWKYNPRYRDESGELWISVIEPFRLWRAGTLDRYRGRPLLAGARHAPGAAPARPAAG